MTHSQRSAIERRRFPVTPLLVVLGATLIILAFAIVEFNGRSEPNDLSTTGSFVGGVGTALALLWIVFNAYMQKKSIDYQLDELQLQREATESVSRSAELDSFLRLTEHADRSITNDVRSLVVSYGKDDAEEGDVAELDKAFLNGDQDAFYRYISGTERFQEWLAQSLESPATPSIATACKAILDKYAALHESVDRLHANEIVYGILLRSAPVSQAARVIERAWLVSDQSPSERRT